MLDRRAMFLKTLDALEEQLDKGFFLSFINKIIVDEKQIYTIINELRSMAPESFDGAGREGAAATFRPAQAREPFAAPAANAQRPVVEQPAPVASSKQTQQAEKEIIEQAMREAAAIRRGADDYARNVLAEIENKLNKCLKSVTDGVKVLDGRLSGE